MLVKILIGVAALLAAFPCGLGLYMWIRWYRLRKRMAKRLDHYVLLREHGVNPFTALTRSRQLFPWHNEESFDWEVLMSEQVWESRSQNAVSKGATEHSAVQLENLPSILAERKQQMTTLTQFEIDNLADGERLIFLERAKEGKGLTRNELEDLRILNYGNPRFGSPSMESVRRGRMSPEEMMYEMTGDAKYLPLSARLGRVLGLGIGVVIWFGPPAFGIIYVWRWLYA